MEIRKITGDNFQTEVTEAGGPVLLDFYADWCNPCRMMGPVVAKMAESFEGKVKVGKCNIDENMELAGKYRVMSIPTIILFKAGEAVSTTVGAVSKMNGRKIATGAGIKRHLFHL